jgi:hypothetical protein
MSTTLADLTRAIQAAQDAAKKAGAYASQASAVASQVRTLYNQFGFTTTWRGAWGSLAAYKINDIVSFLGSSYIAIQANKNKQPDENALDWGIMIGAVPSAGASLVLTGGVGTGTNSYVPLLAEIPSGIFTGNVTIRIIFNVTPAEACTVETAIYGNTFGESNTLLDSSQAVTDGHVLFDFTTAPFDPTVNTPFEVDISSNGPNFNISNPIVLISAAP